MELFGKQSPAISNKSLVFSKVGVKVLEYLKGNIMAKYATIFVMSAILSLGQVLIAKFGRSLPSNMPVLSMIVPLLLNKFLWGMLIVNTFGTGLYIVLTRIFPLYEVFLTNLLFMSIVIVLASTLLLHEPISIKQVGGVMLAVVAVVLLRQ